MMLPSWVCHLMEGVPTALGRDLVHRAFDVSRHCIRRIIMRRGLICESKWLVNRECRVCCKSYAQRYQHHQLNISLSTSTRHYATLVMSSPSQPTLKRVLIKSPMPWHILHRMVPCPSYWEGKPSFNFVASFSRQKRMAVSNINLSSCTPKFSLTTN